MKHAKLLTSTSKLAFVAGLLAVTLVACSDGDSFVAPDLPVIETPPPPAPPPPPPVPPPPPPPPVSATQAASQLGAGFAASFGANLNATPRDPSFGDITSIDPTINPIDIINPN